MLTKGQRRGEAHAESVVREQTLLFFISLSQEIDDFKWLFTGVRVHEKLNNKRNGLSVTLLGSPTYSNSFMIFYALCTFRSVANANFSDQ